MKHTVLVVEDEEDLRDLMKQALELGGYTVVTAGDGGAALEAIERIDHVCVVILDLVMPGMNGWDFFEAFRARPEYADVPVVIHSSTPKSAPAGVTRVLEKPVELHALLSVVHDYCGE